MSNKFISFKIFIVIVIALAIALIVFFKILFPSPISKSTMEKEFLKNKDIIVSVTSFLENQEYVRIYITSTHEKGKMFVSEAGGFVDVSDVSVAENINALFERYNFQVILKNDNSIYFQRWSNRKYGRGIVYSINGELPQNELITQLEPLTEKYWYFYEEK